MEDGKTEPMATNDPNGTPKPQTPGRRTYSITNDIDPDPHAADLKRLPRQGWQNNRQHFRLDEEGDVPLKEQSPVRLPRVGQAPRREFSFSNLSDAYKAGEKPVQKGGHFEFDDEIPPVPSLKGISIGAGTGARVAMVVPEVDLGDKTTDGGRPVKPWSGTGGRRVETIFHDLIESPRDPVKPSIGGGAGGRRPEETIFVELEEDSQPQVERKKTPITRRDQQIHFSLADEPPATPVPNKTSKPSHIIEGTPDPMESEYSARALQRKEMNHFRPDTLSHFDIVDEPTDQMRPEAKKENTEGMNKLLKGIARSWNLTPDSPSPATKAAGTTARGPATSAPQKKEKKDLAPHFSFGDSPVKNDEEKENGRGAHGQKRYNSPDGLPDFHCHGELTRGVRMHVPVKAEEKEWWET